MERKRDNMSGRLYSVIVPVYNASDSLSRCVDSILAQTHDKFELLLVDDGSTDGSIGIIKEYAAADSRVRGLFQGNAGASSARNLGIENATGDYLVFVDADDYIDSTYLCQFDDYTSDVIICGYSTFGDVIESVEPEAETIEGKERIGSFVNYNIGHCYIRTPWAKAIRRDVVNRNGIRFNLNMRLAEDTDFNLQLFGTSRTVDCIHRGGYNYLFNSNIMLKFKISAGEYVYAVDHITSEAVNLGWENVNGIIAYVKKNLYAALLGSFYARNFADGMKLYGDFCRKRGYKYLPHKSKWRRMAATVGMMTLPIQKIFRR